MLFQGQRRLPGGNDAAAGKDLTEEEAAVFRRARNAEVYTKAKNYSLADYHMATALEAVLGYLYLSGEFDRLTALVRTGWERIGNDR